MKVSRTVAMLCAVGVGSFSMMTSQGFATDNGAVNADDILSSQHAPQADAAGENAATMTDVEKGLAEAKAENEDKATLAKKISMAKVMHDIRPTRVQVDSAVRRAAANLPTFERESFIVSMQSMLNYNAIERISIDAMVDTYTLHELESMVEYFSKPEAKSASAKVPSWARAVQPEIVRMIDRAMMRIKTGQ